jgi:hypothetical protein
MKKLLLPLTIFSLLSCKKEEATPPPPKTCWECSGFPLNPDETLDIGCYVTKKEAMDSVPVPEFQVNEAEFDVHCKKK